MGRPGLALFACLLAASASAQEFTALKCHTSRTPRLPPSAVLQLEALVPDFAGRNCRVIGRTKTLCTAGQPVRLPRGLRLRDEHLLRRPRVRAAQHGLRRRRPRATRPALRNADDGRHDAVS
jgi:hypothetical protein